MLPRRYSPLGRLNAVCPYYTMFPLEFPFFALRDASPRSCVLDPFCGRGTTLYAARLRGIPSVGVDSNPVATAIASAKLVSITPDEILALCKEILRRPPSIDLPDGDFWTRCFHPDTLVEICILRAFLLHCKSTDASIALRALLLGLLHGPRTKGEPSYLSNQMPRTYATKPDPAVEFWEKRGLRPRRVDTFRLVYRRAQYVFEQLPPFRPGRVVQGDIRTVRIDQRRKFTDVVTSPPYLGMRCYRADQWLRNWFLGGDEYVEYDESGQLGSATRESFVAQLARIWDRVAEMCSIGARLVVRFGALPSQAEDPGALVKESIARATAPWRVVTTRRVPPQPKSKRQANQFGKNLKTALREVDIYAILSM